MEGYNSSKNHMAHCPLKKKKRNSILQPPTVLSKCLERLAKCPIFFRQLETPKTQQLFIAVKIGHKNGQNPGAMVFLSWKA